LALLAFPLLPAGAPHERERPGPRATWGGPHGPFGWRGSAAGSARGWSSEPRHRTPRRLPSARRATRRTQLQGRCRRLRGRRWQILVSASGSVLSWSVPGWPAPAWSIPAWSIPRWGAPSWSASAGPWPAARPATGDRAARLRPAS
jgi:hypothetical protein